MKAMFIQNHHVENKYKQRISLHPFIWAGIIIITSIRYLVQFNGSAFHFVLRKASFFIFPHEILEQFKYLLLSSTSNPQLYSVPVLSLLFAFCLLLAIALYKIKGRLLPLQIACYVFISSIVLSFPFMITGYFTAMEYYASYTPSGNNGILGLIDDFAAPAKPSLMLLILQYLILLFYITWIVYVLKLINTLKKSNRISPAKPVNTLII